MDETRSSVHKLGSTDTAADTAAEQIRYVAYEPPRFADDNDDDDIDLVEIWGVIMAAKGLIIAVVLLATLLAAGVAFTLTPMYRAEVIMAPEGEERGGSLSALANQFGGLASLAGVSVGGADNALQRILATLKSRIFLFPFLKHEAVLTELFAEQWDPQQGRWAVQDPTDIPTALDAYSLFVGTVLDINSDTKTGIVTLGIQWRDPMLAATWANDLVKRLNEHQRQAAIEQAQQSIDYLKLQLAQTDVVALQQSIYRLIEAQTQAIMLAKVKTEYAMQVIDPALAPEKKISPKRPLIVVTGFILGLVAALFLVFLRRFVQNFRRSVAASAENVTA